MKRYTISPVLLIALALLFFQGCASVDKLVENGHYDQAIELAQRKLSGKQRKSPRFVRAAEEAFAKVTARDMAEIERLKAANRDENWGRINAKYRQIRKRQDAIIPLLPLVDKHGYQATFAFVDVTASEEESRSRAAAFHYSEGLELLDRARNGDKMAARAAYRELEESQYYYRNYRDTEQLQAMAHELGTVHVLVEVINDAPVVTPAEFDRRLKAVNLADLNSFWQLYHLNPRAVDQFDFRINLRILDIAVSPEQVREREYVDTREIEDGYEYVLDENGNVAKDTLGNDIKVPRNVLVKAWVIETYQIKEAQVQANLEVIDLRTNQIIRTQSLGATAIFENYASTFRGDRRALSPETRRRIGNVPMPFPSGEAMIIQAADQLKPALLDRLVDYRNLAQV